MAEVIEQVENRNQIHEAVILSARSAQVDQYVREDGKRIHPESMDL